MTDREQRVREIIANVLSYHTITTTAGHCLCGEWSPGRGAHTRHVASKVAEELAALLASPPAPPSSELSAMEAQKDAAYFERNQVVAALAHCFPSGVARTVIEGWTEDWHGCVYIDLPTGQASWHYHDSHAHLFAGLPPYSNPWDGHTTAEKYERLAALRVPAAPTTLTEERVEEIATEMRNDVVGDSPGDIGFRSGVGMLMRAILREGGQQVESPSCGSAPLSAPPTRPDMPENFASQVAGLRGSVLEFVMQIDATVAAGGYGVTEYEWREKAMTLRTLDAAFDVLLEQLEWAETITTPAATRLDLTAEDAMEEQRVSMMLRELIAEAGRCCPGCDAAGHHRFVAHHVEGLGTSVLSSYRELLGRLRARSEGT